MTMMFSLVACGKNTGSDSSNTTGDSSSTANPTESDDAVNTPADTTGEEPITIEVWTNNRHDENYMTAMIEEFNASQSKIKINYTILTDDYVNSIQLAYQADTAPDIITMSATDGMALNDFVSSEMFVSLSDYIANDQEFQKVTDVYNHMYEELNSIGDDIYWVPNGVRSGTRIQYNKELVSAAGFNEFPSTLSELVELAKVVTEKGDGQSYGVGFTSSGPFGRWLEGIGELSGNTYGGYDFKTGKYDFSSWKDLIETAAQLYQNGSVLPGSETQGVDNSRALFAQGSFAIWGNAAQEAGVFTDQFPPVFDWGVAELPTMNGEIKGAQNITPNLAFTMLSSAKNKDAAWEVIKYFSSEDFLKGYFEGGYGAPISSYMAGVIDSSKVGRLADFALQPYEDVYPATPSITLEGEHYSVVFFNVIQGFMTADDAIEYLNTSYNEALDRSIANGTCKRLIIEDFDPLNPSSGTRTYLTE
jgi:multiple sugar transport system substrate-binding protein